MKRKAHNGTHNGHAGHVNGKPFVKGDPRAGRPKGALNKVTIEAREAASELVDNPEYRAKLAADLQARTVSPAIEQMLWYYAKGKPKEIIEHQGAVPISIVEWVVSHGQAPD